MFAAPLFLASLLAIGLPLWLHRVAQANPQRHTFPSLMLMEASEVQRTSRRTLRYWLLLALRLLLLLALAFAFAGPLLPERAVPAVHPAGRLHAIVLDSSLSMQLGQTWDRAQSAARAIIESARPGDELMLVQASGHHIQVLQDAVSVNRSANLVAALGTIEPGSERLDYGLLMSTAKGWLGAARLPIEFHLISDLQQSASPLRFADLEPPPGARLSFHDVSEARSTNTYIREATLAADGKVAVVVRTTKPAMQSLTAVGFIDGLEVSRRSFQIGPAPAVNEAREGEGSPPEDVLSVSADAHAESQVLLDLPELSPTTHRMEVRLSPSDELAQDDRYFLLLEQSHPRVLVVARANDADEAIYATSAVDALSTPKLKSELHAAQEIDPRTLQQYATILVTDPAALGSDAAARVLAFVRAGGSLLMTLNAGAQNGLLADWRIRNVISRPTQIAQVDASHPVLRNASGWSAIHISRYVQVVPEPEDRILISLQDESPLLIERKLGAGRVLVLTSPLTREWNDLATHPVFVRFMADAASYLTNAEASINRAEVGSVLLTGLNAQQGGQIFDPAGRRVLGLGGAGVADRIVPDRPGFYEIRSAGASRWVAVNVDPRESAVAHMPSGALSRWQGLQKPIARTLGVSTTQDDQATQSERVSIGYALLLACMILLIAEIVAANHFLAVRREVPR